MGIFYTKIIMEETWVDVLGYEGFYQVSNTGNFDIEVDCQQEFIREFGLDRKKLVATDIKITLRH